MARAAPQAGFQPTRPLRGATRAARHAAAYSIISTHAPLAGRDPVECSSSDADGISTHAPLAGRDRRARVDDGKPRLISTHAPLAGRDYSVFPFSTTVEVISTHAPLAGRDEHSITGDIGEGFQPTRPLRGATTRTKGKSLDNTDFNPRAPCGARLKIFRKDDTTLYFNPRAPCGARRRHGAGVPRAGGISTHAPLAGRDGHNFLYFPAS